MSLEFLWMTTQETSVWPQCASRGAALPVVAACGKPIMAFNWDFNCVWWSKSIDYKTGGIWVHTCVFCVSICVAHQILFLSCSVNGFSWNQSSAAVPNHIRHDLHDISIILPTGRDGNWWVELNKDTHTLTSVPTQRCIWHGAVLQRVPSK